jgi:tetratricopeptide (TPR) repeat protein
MHRANNIFFMKTFIKFFLISLFISYPFQGISQGNLFLLGQAAYEQKDFIKASEYLENHQKLFPKHIETKILIAKCKLNLMEYDNALSELIDIKPGTDNEILLLQARACAGKGENEKAFKILENYESTGNKIAPEIIKSYPEFSNMKNLQKWTTLWSTWKYSEKENAINNVKYAIKSEKYSEAADRLDNFLLKYTTNAEAFYLRANIYYQEGDFKNAVICYESALNLDKNNQDYLLGRASAFHKLKRYKRALEEYNLILENDSLAISAYLGRADVQIELNNFQQALNDIAKFRVYYPQNNEALYIEAKANVKSGDFLSAIGEYGQLIKGNPGRPEFFIGRADAYFETKTYIYAIRDYSMALDLDPKNLEVYKKKAKAYQLSGDIKRACIDWGHAVELGDVESMNLIRKYCPN